VLKDIRSARISATEVCEPKVVRKNPTRSELNAVLDAVDLDQWMPDLAAARNKNEHTMTGAVANNRPPVASRPRSRKPATVSASAMALHLDCSRAYISKLEAEGVIQRQGDGFPLDQCRVDYLRFLAARAQALTRTEADADHVKAKSELLQIKIEEKKRLICMTTASILRLTVLICIKRFRGAS